MRAGTATLVLVAGLAGCMQPYEARHQGQWDSADQIWMSEASQLKLRAAQSRVFDTTDRIRLLTAVVQTLQDMGFMIGVLDEELGVVSGKRYELLEDPWLDPSYHLYQTEGLLLFARSFMSWGPFKNRSNLIRVTVTVRKRNEAQTVVRAGAQFYLTAIEDPEPYQRFFRSLAQALFLEAHLFEEPPAK